MKRAAVLGLFILSSAMGLRAFDLQYGSLFVVGDITLAKGRPLMPITRGKYANVRVLDKDTFAFLKTCSYTCKQESAEGTIRLSSLRAAKTRSDMWIADVSVDDKWLLTFLVFSDKDKFDFIVPPNVRILQNDWLSRVKALVRTQILDEKK